LAIINFILLKKPENLPSKSAQVEAFINHMRLIYGSGGVENNSEAKIRALMRMIRDMEGTAGESGYTKIFGINNTFSDMSKHPERPIFWYKDKKTGKDVHSTAAGAYQIMGYNWWGLKGYVVKDKKKTDKYIKSKDRLENYGIKDFSEKSQDEICVVLLKDKRSGFLESFLSGNETYAIEEFISQEWASLTPGRYKNQGPTKGKGKRAKTIHDARMKQLKIYDEYLIEELSGTTDLYLEKGLLKKFKIKCNCSEPKEIIENTKKGLDLNKVLVGLNRKASGTYRKSLIGRCAKYVRLALEDGGMKTDGRPVSAKDYGPFLLKKGFKEISGGNDKPGDIVVFEGFKGPKSNHPDGHIQMYNGNDWVSDFIQTGFWAGSDYREVEPNHKYYRWE